MPAAPRPSKKGTTIAFSIIGTPPNLRKKRKRKRRHNNRPNTNI